MSDVIETPKKSKTEYIKVTMTDGRVVDIPKSRKVQVPVLEGETEGTFIGLRFDFVNGETRTFLLSECPENVVNYAACHGLKQKITDDWAGMKNPDGSPASVDDVVIAADEMMDRLRGGDWRTEREAGDSTAGASIVMQALAEVTAKTVREVKELLDAKLKKMKADAEAAGQTPPTRQKLYATFRDPRSAIGKKIRELEEARAAKNAVGDADALVADLAA